MNGPPQAGEIWSVTRITQTLQALLSREFRALWVEGEVSNYTRSQAGHRYFTLKDDRNQIKAALFRGRAAAVRFEPADGQKVLAYGTVEVYGPRSEYQIIVGRLLPAGQGELELAFRQLHARLSAEGLFEAERKRPLPRFPRRIGVVTSPHGAAVRDILKVLRRRAPQVQVVVAPAQVQGEGASSSIVRAIGAFNRLGNVDLLIVGRGGGSLEDLWAFNEEPTVRAVADSDIPVISAVGHEIDTTLCDLAADVRAATPSVAAELAVVDCREWERRVRDLARRLAGETAYLLGDGRHRLAALVKRYGFRRPEDALRTFAQSLDLLWMRMLRTLNGRLVATQKDLQGITARPVLRHPVSWLRPYGQRTVRPIEHLKGAMRQMPAQCKDQLNRSAGRLDALSPRAVLDRGYAVVMDDRGHVVDSIAHLEARQELSTWLRDGRLHTRILKKEKKILWP
jgi:exodeoxyribonuclease VII large subunit